MKDTESLKDAADRLLERMELVPPREPGEQLRPIEEATILELSAAGKTQAEIAGIIGCNQSTVSRTLAEWTDTRGFARKYAEAKSLDMMKRFVKDASPAEILKMQQKLDVIRDDRQEGGNQLIVMLGTAEHPLSPPDIELFDGKTNAAIDCSASEVGRLPKVATPRH
jgi:hypothetical protein